MKRGHVRSDRAGPGAAGASPLERALAGGIRERGPISLAEFMETALYHPEHGYYQAERQRIGLNASSDFFTAYAAGDVFAELVTTAALRLLEEAPPELLEWVEIGAERGRSLWKTAPKPFRSLRSLALGDNLRIPPEAVVFSNELFDARPFHRVRFTHGGWKETGVGIEGSRFVETVLEEPTAAVEALRDRLPPAPPPNSVLDLPAGAVSLLERIVSQRWQGLFVAFDYGKRWEELIHEHPHGTLRAYSRHRQNPDILARPGQQDITGHICWDWMGDVLSAHGFHHINLDSQESFFVKYAAPAIERIIQRRPGLPDPARQRLQQLIHPANMGRKFQVLSARRNSGGMALD